MTIVIDDGPEVPETQWRADNEARLAVAREKEQKRQSRNRYVVDCLRQGVKPDAALMRPDAGYVIPETPEMYRG